MRIEGILWYPEIVEKIVSKHHVEPEEAEQALRNDARFRFVEKGDRPGEDVYMALGRSHGGRYLAVLFIHKRNGKALVLSARDMAGKERRIHDRK